MREQLPGGRGTCIIRGCAGAVGGDSSRAAAGVAPSTAMQSARGGMGCGGRMRLILSICLPFLCAPITKAQSTVAETGVRSAKGELATGTIKITATPSFTAADGTVVSETATVAVTNGRFSVSLRPNDTGFPGGTIYVAQWQLSNSRPERQLWSIPTTETTLRVRDVLLRTEPTANYYSAVGLADGTYCVTVTGGAVTSGPAPCAASPSSLTLAALTNSQLSALTNGQLAGMTN